MKVVQLLTQSSGGPCDHAVDVAVELSGRGHDVLMVLPDGPAADRSDALGLRRVAVTPRHKRDLRGALDLAGLMHDERPDVVHCQDRRAGLVGRLLSRRRGGVVYTLHGVPDSLSALVRGNLQVAERRPRDRPAYLWAERALALRGAPVVVPSRALADYVVEHVGVPERQVHVVRNGVDPVRFAPGLRDEGSSSAVEVLWIGAVVPTKRVDVLIDALVALDVGAPVSLALAGTGELEPELRARAERSGVADRVRWLGWVAEPAALLATAEVVCLPSAAENLPLVLLQAMASGAAVVASAVGGVPELVDHGRTGLLVPPGDVAALATALRDLAEHPERRRAMGVAARAAVLDGWTTAACVDSLLDVYEEAVRR